MKKILCLISLLMPFCLSTAYADIPVNNFEEFNSALLNAGLDEGIILSSGIVISEDINKQNANSIFIKGADDKSFIVDGNESAYKFQIDADKTIKFLSLKAEKFLNSLNSSGAEVLGSFAYNEGNIIIDNSDISKNSIDLISEDSSEIKAYGGAVYNAVDAKISINKAIFEENFASAQSTGGNALAYGGAIYNAGTAEIIDSNFIKNSTNHKGTGQSLGGAIYNSGILNILADTQNVEFSGNRASIDSNAIHNTNEINLNTSGTASIIINDAITGEVGNININRSGIWLTDYTNGIVEINNSLKGNNINIYKGTLKLGNYAGNQEQGIPDSIGSIGSYDDRYDLYINDGAVLDLANDRANDIVYIKDFTTEGISKINIDVDLRNFKFDKLDISGSTLGSGTINFSGLKILSDFTVGVSTDIKVFVNDPTVNYLAGTDFYTYRENSKYHIMEGSDLSSLNLTLVSYVEDPFQNAILQSGNVNLDLNKDYYVPAEFNPNIAGSLTIDGGFTSINGNNISNIFSLADVDKNIELKDLTVFNGQSEAGGAIYNAGNVFIENMFFRDNIATSTDTANAAKGGAVYNKETLNIYDTSFIANIAEGDNAVGGAIYNEGTVNLIAQSKNIVFNNNKAGNRSNAIHSFGGGKLNLNAFSERAIVLNDSISSEGNNNIININASQTDDPSSLISEGSNGIVFINADMTQFGNIDTSIGNTVNFFNGSILLGNESKFFENVEFNMYGGTKLNMRNGKQDNIAINNFNLPGTELSYMSLEVDLKNALADNLIGTVLNDDTGKIEIDELFIVSDIENLNKKTSILIADDPALQNAISLSGSQKEVLGPVFSYFVDYDRGSLNIRHTFDFNPGVFIAPITMQTGGYLGQLHSYSQAFDSIDDIVSEDSKRGLWLKPYAFSEDIELSDKLTVSNTAYGAYLGYDTLPSIIGIGKRYNVVFSFYGSYNSSKQTYKESEINQGGGLIGATAVIFKERFFTAFTANAGIISEHGQSKYGKDNFMMYTKGLAAKTGYNFSLPYDENITIQPSLNLSYSSISIAPYKNSRDVEVTTAGLVPFHIEPGVKFTANLANNWLTYANISMVWSLSDDTDCKANGIKLPALSIDPYMQYSIGLKKPLSESIAIKAELFGRTISREGFGVQINLNWAFGDN